MKVVVLAGGLGTRLSEETEIRPKPLVEIGGEPILWHIMKHYEHYGYSDFVVALGYKGDMVKRYFVDRSHLSGDLKISLATGRIESATASTVDWTLNLINTGALTQTGGRLRRLAALLGEQRFMLTYGDGVGNINLRDLVRFHERHGKMATITAVRPPARFGSIDLHGDMVAAFNEKSQVHEGWINGGFMVLEQGIQQYLHGDDDSLESVALEQLARDGQLMAYRHEGFWHPMDTLRDVRELERLWNLGAAPWREWE